MPDYYRWVHPGSGTKTPRCWDNLVGKVLSDRRIKYYENRGWYSAEQKQARKVRSERKVVQVAKELVGTNFRMVDGRMIYCP